MRNPEEHNYDWRFYCLLAILALGVLGLLWRMLDLSVFNRPFLLKQSDARAVRIVSTPAYRGMITDRYGTPLAISTPVDSVWVNPEMFQASTAQLNQLARLLGLPAKDVRKHIDENSEREFVYLKRGLPPEVASAIKNLNIPGVFFQREYRRYYPEGEVATHVIGFTNVDDFGQEGLELAYDKWLRGIPGKERVLKDRLGHTIAIMNVLSQPVQGHDLALSIDDRIQYLAYRYLKDAVQANHAEAGSVVVLNPKTGEILAMANVPSYNPNQRVFAHDGRFRNRAVTDLFEPGSTVKAFSVASALESGKYTPDSKIDTSPGWLMIDGNQFKDAEKHDPIITVTQVLQKSSDIGVAKMTLSLAPDRLWNMLQRFGFAQSTQSGFPGEVPGTFIQSHRIIDLATLSFGYSISVTALQLVHAYAALANNGNALPVTFLRLNQAPGNQSVISAKLAQEMLAMLESTVQSGGTARLAAVPGYRIAGKTGTAYVAGQGGYDKKHYTASFVGVAPVSNPQLVMAVVLNNVQGKSTFWRTNCCAGICQYYECNTAIIRYSTR